MIIKYQETKTIKVRENDRSSNVVTANFILGCSSLKSDTYESPCKYCYVARFGRKALYINTNTNEILNEVDKWVQTKPSIKTSDQVHPTLYLADIGCDTDINFMWNHYNWVYVFDFFKNHPKLGATFATKWVNTKLLEYEPNQKIRVRMSLMPEITRRVLEKGTSPIINRIKFLNKLVEADYSTHINFSPIVYQPNWLGDYKELFKIIDGETSDEFKKQAESECIFLTHNNNLHNINLQKAYTEAEQLLWNPTIQEDKTSQYGGENLRYQWQFKNELISKFKQLHNEMIPWCNIRYIF